ncbi:hypothetical protein [Stenotrophomonas rhizophila]
MDAMMEPAADAAAEDTGAGRELSFSWLHQKVAAYVAHSLYPKPSRVERASVWIAVGAAGIGLLVGALHPRLLAAQTASTALTACVVVELAGFAVHLFLLAKRELPQLLKPRLTHAAEMDFDFAYWRQLVAEIRGFPRSQCEEMLRFAGALRDRMNERMGLVYGGFQRLGIFPVLVALYLQFRNWTWGDWASAFDVKLVAGLLIWMMVLMYAAGWLLIGLRVRVETYVNLLESALQGERVLGK